VRGDPDEDDVPLGIVLFSNFGNAGDGVAGLSEVVNLLNFVGGYQLVEIVKPNF